MIKLRIFVSSVRNELSSERRAVKAIVSSDPFLDEHSVAILHEDEPSMMAPRPTGYLDTLDLCQLCVVILGAEYGRRHKGLSATHHEYHHAHEKGIPILPCIKTLAPGRSRDGAVEDFIEDIKRDGYDYERFATERELQEIVRRCLVPCIKQKYHVTAPSRRAAAAMASTIRHHSDYAETRNVRKPGDGALVRVGWDQVDVPIARQLAERSAGDDVGELNDDGVKEVLLRRGLLWLDGGKAVCCAAGILLFARDPGVAYPQSVVHLVAYAGSEPDASPRDHEDLHQPVPTAVESVLRFVDRNTRHPMQVVKLKRRRLDEYPTEVVREAFINAAAHRDYEDATRRIRVEVFPDRIQVSSPGAPPGELTVRQLQSALKPGSVSAIRPCSRNPSLAQGLRILEFMDELGSGLRRMRDGMLKHGLEAPTIAFVDGYLQLTLPGPGEDLGRVGPDRGQAGLPEEIETALNDRQRRILAHVGEQGAVTTRWCRNEFSVAYQTVHRDIAGLIGLGLLRKTGAGPRTRYEPGEEAP